MKKILVCVMLGAIAAVGVQGNVPAETPTAGANFDWPQWRGPARTGISEEKGWLQAWPAEGPKILWQAALGTGFSSFATQGDRVYTLGHKDGKDVVWCLNANTGEEVWKFEYPAALYDIQHEGGPSSTPTIDGDRVYTLSKQGDVFCLNAATGAKIWHDVLPEDLGAEIPRWGFSGSPVVSGELLILDAGPVAALNKMTGKTVWMSPDYKVGYSSPVLLELEGKPCVALFNGSGLVVVDVADGKPVADLYPWGREVNAAAPIVSGNKILVSSSYNQGAALVEVANGKQTQLWKNANMRNHINSSVKWNDHVYGFDDKDLRCIDFNTGEPTWTQDGLGKGSLMLADGKLIILSESGELVLAEAAPDAFKELARAQVLGGKCWTVPVLSNGKVFCRNAAGDMVCVSLARE